MAEAAKREMGLALDWIGATSHGHFAIATIPPGKAAKAVAGLDYASACWVT